MADFEKAIPRLLEKEGGLTNDKEDRGGLTKYGITKKGYPHLDIAALTKPQASAIYRADYWNKMRLDEVESQAKAALLFEMGVNFGIVTVIKMAQNLIDTDADGIVGQKTLAAINGFEETLFVVALKLMAVDKYRRICNSNKSQKTFLLGWLNRIFS